MAPNKKTNLDKITDFKAKIDKIALDNKVFKTIGKDGHLKKDAFWTGSASHDASDKLIYNKQTHALFYDSDGIGHAAQVQIATLTGTKNLKLAYTDFLVI